MFERNTMSRMACSTLAAMPIFEPMFRELNDAGARYVIVGGLAVVLHGHRRLTADLDLVIDLTPVEVQKTVAALEGLGLRPQLPVHAADLARASVRERWVRERGMLVFTLRDATGYRAVDLLTASPIPFAELWERAVEVVLEDTTVHVASIPDLIQMKRLAGRPKDWTDIEALESILEKRGRQEGR